MKHLNETVSVCQYNELLNIVEHELAPPVLEFYNHLFSPLDDAKRSLLYMVQDNQWVKKMCKCAGTLCIFICEQQI